MAGTQMVCLRQRLLLNTAFLILLSACSLASERRCHWCGPRAEQVHRSQRAPDCSSYADHIIDCEPPNTHCAIVLTAPPYAESRICVKLYQDECYSVYCNTTRVWKMTCPCQGDLCNGAKTAREEDAYNVLMKLIKNQNKIMKRSTAFLSGPKVHSKMLNPDDTDGNEIEAHVPQEEPQMASASTEGFSPSADSDVQATSAVNSPSMAHNPETTSTEPKAENTTPGPEIKDSEKTTMPTENTSPLTIISTEAVQITEVVKNDQESKPEPEQESNESNPSDVEEKEAEDGRNTSVEQTNTDAYPNMDKPMQKPEEEMQADQPLKPDSGPVPEPLANEDMQSDKPGNSKEFTVTIEVGVTNKTSTEIIPAVKPTNNEKSEVTTKATESNVNVKSAAESPTVVVMQHDTMPMDVKPSLATKMESMSTMTTMGKMAPTMKPNGKNGATRSQIHIWLALCWPIILKTL